MYSLRRVTQSTEAMTLRLGLDGYAFAKVDAVPQVDPDTKQLSLALVVDPGHRVYVRRINFSGTTSVNDEVFRREMRQLEGSYLSNAAVERSKQRICNACPSSRKSTSRPRRCPAHARPGRRRISRWRKGLPGQFGGGIGYSESQSFILNGNIVHSNFLGTGERVALELNSGNYAKAYSLSHTNPFVTLDGIGRTTSTCLIARSRSSPPPPRTSPPRPG